MWGSKILCNVRYCKNHSPLDLANALEPSGDVATRNMRTQRLHVHFKRSGQLWH
jgi:hypothetical protein